MRIRMFSEGILPIQNVHFPVSHYSCRFVYSFIYSFLFFAVSLFLPDIKHSLSEFSQSKPKIRYRLNGMRTWVSRNNIWYILFISFYSCVTRGNLRNVLLRSIPSLHQKMDDHIIVFVVKSLWSLLAIYLSTLLVSENFLFKAVPNSLLNKRGSKK